MVTTRRRRRGTTVTAALAAAATIAIAGCGDDDEDADRGSGDHAEWCDAFVEASSVGDGTADQDAAVDRLVAATDAADEDVVERFIAEFAATPDDGPPAPTFFEAYTAMAKLFGERCDAPSVDVTAADYAFVGVPESWDAGPTVVSFANEGAEVHEMLLVRKADGESRTAIEILAADEFDPSAIVDGVLGFPGSTNSAVWSLEPGEYFVTCFLPVGATPEAFEEMMAGHGDDEAPPHFTQGMVADFTVDG